MRNYKNTMPMKAAEELVYALNHIHGTFNIMDNEDMLNGGKCGYVPHDVNDYDYVIINRIESVVSSYDLSMDVTVSVCRQLAYTTMDAMPLMHEITRLYAEGMSGKGEPNTILYDVDYVVEDEEEVQQEAAAAEEKVDERINKLFAALSKAAVLLGAYSVRDDAVAIINAVGENEWTLDAMKRVGKACYDRTEYHIKRLEVCGDVVTARELRRLFGEGEYNIFEMTFGLISHTLCRLGRFIKNKLAVDIQNKLVQNVFAKLKGFCSMIKKATTEVLKAVAKGVSMVAAFGIKTAVWVVHGIKWLVSKVVQAIKDKRKPKADSNMDEATEEMFANMANSTSVPV